LVLLVLALEDTFIWKKWEEMYVDFAFCKGLKFSECSKQEHHQQGQDIDGNASASLTELPSPPSSSTPIIVCDDEEDILTVLSRALKTKSMLSPPPLEENALKSAMNSEPFKMAILGCFYFRL
jgi:hypothetical protein